MGVIVVLVMLVLLRFFEVRIEVTRFKARRRLLLSKFTVSS